MIALDYAPILFLLALGGGLAVFFLLGSVFLGPALKNPIKAKPFECGHPSEGQPSQRFSIKFYSIAILFILFDIEAVFIFPWAVALGGLKLFGLIEMLIFLVVLAVALAYVWAKGGLEWD